MFRRILAAVLIAVVAAPLPAMASGGCPMQRPSVVAKAMSGCDCCKQMVAGESRRCPTRGALAAPCNCSIEADTGRNPATPAATVAPQAVHAGAVVLLPASRSTPQWTKHPAPRIGAPPGARASVRTLLCIWTL
jgi:hypothetical protein